MAGPGELTGRGTERRRSVTAAVRGGERRAVATGVDSDVGVDMLIAGTWTVVGAVA